MTAILSNDEVRHCCQRYCLESNENNLQIINYEINEIDGTPNGFLGQHRFLTVHVRQHSSGNSNTSSANEFTDMKLKFFLKTVPDNKMAAQMEYMHEFGVFKKEVSVFKYIIPRLENIHIDSKHLTPKCYLAKDSILIFENLADAGFRMGAKRDGILSYNHLMVALNALANIHSASLIMELRANGQHINQIYKEILDENSYPNDPNSVRAIYFGRASNALTNLIKFIPKYQNSDRLEFIENEFPKKLKLIFTMCQTSTKYRNTFSHGDLWANNIMFSYDSQNEPIECRLVDFQLARYAPPILDVITILTITTTSEFREKHLHELLEHYWNMLKMYLNKHNIQLDDLITSREFNESIEAFKLAGLIESCLFSHLTLLPEELTSTLLTNSNDFDNFLNYQRNELCCRAFESDEMYRNRLTDMISDIIDNYILCT